MTVVLIPCGPRLLALDRDQFERALRRGDSYLPATSPAVAPVPAANDEPLLTAQEAADLTRLPPSTLYRQAKAGKVPAVRIGRFYRFRRSDLLGCGSTVSESVG